MVREEKENGESKEQGGCERVVGGDGGQTTEAEANRAGAALMGWGALAGAWSKAASFLPPAHPSVPPPDDFGVIGEVAEADLVDRSQRAPRVGLGKLWESREELWSTVNAKVSATSAVVKDAAAQLATRTPDDGRNKHVEDESSVQPTSSCPAQRVVAKNPLRFLGRDEWLALLPLQVLVQRVRGGVPCKGTLHATVAEGAFELWTAGKREGTLAVGTWQCRIFGERGPPLERRLGEFFAHHCPDNKADAVSLAREYGAWNEDQLNCLLGSRYGADLTSMPGYSQKRSGWGRAIVRRVAPLIFVIRGAMDVRGEGERPEGERGEDGAANEDLDCEYALTFPHPYAKRTRFIEELESILTHACEYTNRVPSSLLHAALATPPPRMAADASAGENDRSEAAQAMAQGLEGFALDYAETSVPEKRGPLRPGADGRAFYGSKIEAGGHQISMGLRHGSVWISGKMVEGSQRFSKWLGPAAEEAKINPKVKQGLQVAQKGTQNLLALTCDVIGALGNVAARGVSWGADKVSQTQVYREWETRPSGPRAKAAREVAESTVAALFTVGYGLRDASHTLLDAGLAQSIVHASQARWGEEAGEAAQRSCASVLNAYYTLIYSGHFLERGAAEVVGHVGKMMVLDVATKALLIDDLKAPESRLESPLLMNELEALGGSTSVWTCFVCVLRQRTLALYLPMVAEGTGKLASAGLRVRALFKGGHKVIDYIEPGGGGDRTGALEVGDVIMAVDGMPAHTMSVKDMESILAGTAGSLVRLLVCSGKELQAHADQAQVRSGLADLAAAGIQLSDDQDQSLQRPLVDVRMRDVVIELLPGTLATNYESRLFSAQSDEGGMVEHVAGNGCDDHCDVDVDEAGSGGIPAAPMGSGQADRETAGEYADTFMVYQSKTGPAKLHRVITISDLKTVLRDPEGHQGRSNTFAIKTHSNKKVCGQLDLSRCLARSANRKQSEISNTDIFGPRAM